MSDEKKIRRTHHTVPDPERVIELGQQPTVYIVPPKPPKHVKDSGIGNVKKS